MTISIWRYSHLTLAISSFIFIILAALTGIILALEPISNQLKPFAIDNTNTITLADAIPVLKQNYKAVISIEKDANNFISASVITKDNRNETFYINALNGKKVGEIIEKAPLFKFATNLHRSLFLKTTGRLIVGFVSLILLLMAVTGIVLIAKRQGGYKRFFSTIIKEHYTQYYHIVVGRYTLIPIIIVTLTGIYLSLDKFSLLPKHNISHTYNEVASSNVIKTDLVNFIAFKNITLNDIKRVEFPFSEAVEDYYLVKLNNRELLVNQYTGNIISEQHQSLTALLLQWSLTLHTGRGSISWSILLLITCCAILFFVYSGFAMSLKKKRKKPLAVNTYTKDEAEYIILVGSESGSTYRFANTFFNALINAKKAAFITELNNYSTYKKASQLIILTATYGDGEAPSNAKHFEKLLHSVNQNKQLRYSVIGFGSLLYPKYCNYATLIDASLQAHTNFIPSIVLHKINNQSFEAFKNWEKAWSQVNKLSLDVKPPAIEVAARKTSLFTVSHKTDVNKDQTFLIYLIPNKKLKFTSGDLLAIYPENDAVKRLYSIGKIDSKVVLSIKKHDLGKCSNYLNELNTNDMISASIERNPNFHFPKHNKDVIMIANGTGIAPFLGMIQGNTKQVKTHLFWGGRTQASFGLYSELVDNAFANKTLTSIHVAYSQAYEQKIYVQDLVLEQQNFISKSLQNGATIMICGSVAMQSAILEILEQITKTQLGLPLSTFENREQIKMDCY